MNKCAKPSFSIGSWLLNVSMWYRIGALPPSVGEYRADHFTQVRIAKGSLVWLSGCLYI